MNKIIIISFLLLGVISCQEKAEVKVDHEVSQIYYTCAMHPDIKESGPGKCPICHMNLTKVESSNPEHSDNHEMPKAETTLWQCKDFPNVTSLKEDICPIDGTPMVLSGGGSRKIAEQAIAQVMLRNSQLTHFRPQLFPVTTMQMKNEVRLLGNVLQSEDKESSITARIQGRVEKVYVKSTGSFIKEGDLVLDYYSPRLISAGEEYLVNLSSYKKSPTRDFKDLLKQSRERLLLWGIKKEQLEEWAKNQVIPKSIPIYSPATGIVRQRNAISGKYFKEGQNFFELSDLSDVWVEMDVYEQDAGLINFGQKVNLKFSALPGIELQSEVDFVAPILDAKSRTLKIRATVKNKNGLLKPGMIADASLTILLKGEPLVVPRAAIIDTGKRKVVWLKKSPQLYHAHLIKTGFESSGYVEVLSGLKMGDEIVLDGNFLIDAQAQLFGGYESMTSSPGHTH
ncbi:MAG: efflux RND transporter periplasmic adaptor subunit [Bacteriovoracaceae bacterium]|nr:efflux RND transporter periplasmic adaptor subunit [Bacteriovoracaceae bacterium]